MGWSWQNLSLDEREMNPPRLVWWEQWDQQASGRKMQFHYKMAKWCDITIKERLPQITEEQIPEGTLKKIEDSWWNNKEDEVQQFANSKKFKGFFSSLYPNTTPLLSFDGITLQTKEASYGGGGTMSPTYLTDSLLLTHSFGFNSTKGNYRLPWSSTHVGCGQESSQADRFQQSIWNWWPSSWNLQGCWIQDPACIPQCLD